MISVAVIAAITALIFVFGKSLAGAFSIGLAAYLAVGTLTAFAKKIKIGQVSFAQSLHLFGRQSGSTFGFLFAHLGIAIAMVGITAMSVWGVENVGVLKRGESLNVAGYEFSLNEIDVGRRDNFEYLTAGVGVTNNGKDIANLKTERRFYPVRNIVTSEAGIRVRLSANLYVGISEGNESDGWAIRAYYHPYVCWIWIGTLLMALAGFISLADGRMRFSAKEPEIENPSLAVAE
jgi:cytochrome c-type biogenesis protein CcmF